jgi:hypothetical protein
VVDPEDADVVEDVPADDPRRDAVAVRELDVDRRGRADLARRLARIRDHVGVREDRPVGIDDEARPLRLGTPERGEDGEDAGGPVAEDAARREACGVGRGGSGWHRPWLGDDDGGAAVAVAGAADQERCRRADEGAENGEKRDPHAATVSRAVFTWKDRRPS